MPSLKSNRSAMPPCATCGHHWGVHAKPPDVEADVDDGKRWCFELTDDGECRCTNYMAAPAPTGASVDPSPVEAEPVSNLHVVHGSTRFFCRADGCGAFSDGNVPYGYCDRHLALSLTETVPDKLGFPTIGWNQQQAVAAVAKGQSYCESPPRDPESSSSANSFLPTEMETKLREVIETMTDRASGILNATNDRYRTGRADGILETVEAFERGLAALLRPTEER